MTSKLRATPARLKTGATVLTNAQAVNTRPIRGRFHAFSEAHRLYSDAQAKVDEADHNLLTQRNRVTELDTRLGDELHGLVGALLSIGQPLSNAFAGFSDVGPGTIKVMPPAEAVAAVRALAASVRRYKANTPETLSALDRLEQTAAEVEAALPPVEVARQLVEAARTLRDTYAQNWDAEYANLRLAARGSEREVPGLFAALFGRNNRSSRKNRGTPVTVDPAAIPATPDPAPPRTSDDSSPAVV